MRLSCLIALASVAAASAPAEAPKSWTIFGMELGKPVALPTCKHKALPGGGLSQYVYEDDPAETCHEPDIVLRDAPWRRGAVNFPLARIPLIVRGSTGFTLIVEGKLEGLQFDTPGYSHASAIIDELAQKFGRPSSVTRTTATPSNIPVPAVHAEWKLQNLYVSYRSIDYSIDSGFLEIETPTMQALRKKRQQEQENERTKL